MTELEQGRKARDSDSPRRRTRGGWLSVSTVKKLVMVVVLLKLYVFQCHSRLKVLFMGQNLSFWGLTSNSEV